MEWRLIESAPKDGTPVDLWVVFPLGGHRWVNAKWLESGNHSCSGAADWCSAGNIPLHAFTQKPKATHWMPLPLPPNTNIGD